jgi:predicted nucleic acid-binding protein
MQVFDASSMIYAWDNYPIAQFPGLWEWMADRVATGVIRMSEVAVEEVGHKTPECVAWLKTAGLQKMPVTEAILLEAFRMKSLLEIEEDQYGSGVDENDLFIIATAKLNGSELVTDEGFQADLPKNKRKYKIPAVCGMTTVNVSWLGFLAYIKRSEAVFG